MRVWSGNPTQLETRRGWFIGHFMPASEAQGLRHSDVAEAKWGVHEKGDYKGRDDPSSEWTSDTCTSMSIVVRGSFQLHFASVEDEEGDGASEAVTDVHLEGEGACVIWDSDAKHTWEALADTVILTVRWGDLESKQTRKHRPPLGWQRPLIEA